MKTFAIDPGPTESAFVIWNGERIERMGKVPNLSLLAILGQHERECRNVCEMIASYGMAVGREVFETCVWIGRFVQAAGGDEHMARVERLKVKQHLCHDSRAKDSNIRQAIIDRLGAPGTKKAPGITFGVSGDIWAALALALTYHDQRTSQHTV